MWRGWHGIRQGALKLEAGVEGAINVLSSRSTLTLGGAPVILPAANIRLEEKRVEVFSTATWRFNPVLMSELGARYETSTLTQSGDSSLTKDLAFFKPRWLTTWNPAPGHELRLLMERQVGQLVFRDFASSTSLNSNTVTGGNKNLEPARSWNISLAWERHFWKRGSLVLEAGGNSSPMSWITCRYSPGHRFSTRWAISATAPATGSQANLILPLDELGLEGVTVNSEAVWHHSRVRDPATGMYRQIVGGQTVGSPAYHVHDHVRDHLRYAGEKSAAGHGPAHPCRTATKPNTGSTRSTPATTPSSWAFLPNTSRRRTGPCACSTGTSPRPPPTATAMSMPACAAARR